MERGKGRGAARRKKSPEPQSPVSKRVRTESNVSPKASPVPKLSGHPLRPRKKPVPDIVLRSRTNNQVKIHEDYTCMLYKTEKDGTKFCLLQVACFKEKYVFFMRSGLKGEDGKWHAAREPNVKEAMKSFKKMFREKTGVGWNTRDSFVAQPGKYILAEKDEDDGENEEISDDEGGQSAEEEEIQPLDERTELMVKLILDRDMFLDQLAVLKLDTNKVTLEKLNEKLFDKTEEIFSDIEKAVKFRKPPSVLRELWTKFYQTIAHQDQERGSCPQQAVDNPEVHLFKKKELMSILSDTRLTWNTLEEIGHMSLEEQFHQLGCKLRLLEKDSEEYKLLEEYAGACPNSRRGTLLDVWSVHRPQDKIRAEEHAKLDYRKLLWYGVNVAQMAAVLQHGLRITPFSGGSLGKGIYLTPEHAKASWNVGVHWGKYEDERNVGFMFLVETALGRMRYIKMGNSSLTRPPDGFNSIAAKGRLEPDPSNDEMRKFDGKRVVVPIGPPVPQKEFEASGFLQSQYVVYDEGQVQLRYLTKFSFA